MHRLLHKLINRIWNDAPKANPKKHQGGRAGHFVWEIQGTTPCNLSIAGSTFSENFASALQFSDVLLGHGKSNPSLVPCLLKALKQTTGILCVFCVCVCVRVCVCRHMHVCVRQTIVPLSVYRILPHILCSIF
jgi:hypothetical protein